MLISAFICVCFFSIFYYSFVPVNRHVTYVNSQKKCVNCTDGNSINSNKLPVPEYLGEGDNKNIITRSGTFDLKALLTCFYFSGVTFTTLGYGDIKPQGLVRYVAMMEAGLGAFLMALFVFSFTRRNALRQ